MLQSLASNSCVRLIQSHKSTWYFVSLVLGYVLYLVFGAVVFSSVELPYEDLLRQELRTIKKQFLQENECLSEDRLERFLKKALDASNYGVSILNNASDNWNWDFTSALFFASTVLSTTGKCWSPRTVHVMLQPTRRAEQHIICLQPTLVWSGPMFWLEIVFWGVLMYPNHC